MNLPLSFGIVCVIGTILVSGAPDNRGTEFIIGFMDNYQETYDLELFITTSRTTSVNVRVRCPNYGSLDESFTVTSGYVKMLTFSYSYRVSGSLLENKGILITADDEVVAYGVNKQKYSNDAFLALPTDVLGTEYYTVTYYPPTRKTQIMVVGVHDSTSVTIKFPSGSWARTTDSYNGKTYATGSTLTLTLNKYQTFQIQGAGDLTGAYITSDKAISVFSGNQKTNTGTYTSSDHLVEHLTPVNTWGKTFATVPIPLRTIGDYFKVIASEDNTKIQYKCRKSNSYSTYSITLSKAGDFQQETVASGKYCHWVADKAVLLTQIVLSQKDSSEPADPSLLIIPPMEQYAADYTFTTPKYSGGSYDNYFLFIVKDSEKSGLKVDGGSFPASTSYTEIPDTDYVGGYINVADGSHTVRHDSPISVFGGFLYGKAIYESYGFPTGMRLAGVNQVCVPTTTVVGDGVDNDCDGLIDEELCTTENKGADDDGDGTSDEDCATPSPIDGNWAAWQSWVTCSQSCTTTGNAVTGTKTRVRTCTDPEPKYDGKQCTGDSSESTSCTSTTYCPIDGMWAEWGQWSSCSVTCASGTQTRERTCTDPSPQHGGAYCDNPSTNTSSTTCTLSPCPIDGMWAEWGQWGSCSVTCASGTQTRERSCTDPSPQHGGSYCDSPSSNTSSKTCSLSACPIDGLWAEWGQWSSCSVTCASGTQTRERSCTDPSPQHGGSYCDNPSTNTSSTTCTLSPCPIDGSWTAWSSWSSCPVTCGIGNIERQRTCTDPSPQYNGADCAGNTTDTSTCNLPSCIIDGMWGAWASWGTCTHTCGGGFWSRSRVCDNPRPDNGGEDCNGTSAEYDICNTTPCATVASGTYVQVCPLDWFTCGSGKIECISWTYVCDCYSHCEDGSDEVPTYAGCSPLLASRCHNSAEGMLPGMRYVAFMVLLAVVLSVTLK